MKYTLIRAAFEALWLAQMPRLSRHLSQSRGVIFTLHRVLPEPAAPFSPNAILQVLPDFLDYVIERLGELDIDIITLDQAVERLAAPEKGRAFVVLTFDDAYRDNLQYGHPILKRHNVPFTLYVSTALAEGTGEIWWQAIEDIVSCQDFVEFSEGAERVETRTVEQKHKAFDRLYWQMRKQPEDERLSSLAAFCERYDYDLERQCRELIMDWDDLRLMANDPLCTIGAHTVNHYELSKLSLDEARREMLESVDVIEAELGVRPQHFSYPLGGPLSCGPREFDLARDVGFKTAVTTRPGGLYPHHLQSLHALPRVSLNGYYQEKRFVEVFAAGGLFTLLGRFAG